MEVALFENLPVSSHLPLWRRKSPQGEETVWVLLLLTCWSMAETYKLAYSMLEIRLTGRALPLRTSMANMRNEISIHLGYCDKCHKLKSLLKFISLFLGKSHTDAPGRYRAWWGPTSWFIDINFPFSQMVEREGILVETHSWRFFHHGLVFQHGHPQS